MIRTSLRRAVVPGIAVLTLAALSACGAGNETAGDGGSGSGSSDAPAASTGLEGTLDGAGATSQEKVQDAWKTTVQGFNGGKLTINYGLVGSTDGRSQFIAGTTLFAGSDSYLKEDEDELAKAKERCGGTDPIEVPAYVSSIAIAFNLPGITSLNLQPDVIADIFNNKITKWNDPKIVADNPDASLPDAEISPVHRADDSGTTKNFTDYLGKAAEANWPYEAEDAFPVSGGNSQAAEKTSGVVDLITGTENTIGYADESQIGDLGVVSVGVGDTFVAPSGDAAAKTVAVSPRVEGRSDVDMATDVDRTTTEEGAYPVILLSYLIACQQYDDPQDAKNVKGYLSYIVSDAGQQLAADQAGSAKLTGDVATEAQSIVDKIQG